ncbi:MAG: FAD-binding oxidoreductase, partial [Gammaproteobacteria bacterium]|nr:FAD-binding oxidoreductase [Gammaproteobacteria bacterium]
LARSVESMGVTIFEHSPVLAVNGKTLRTAEGRIKTDIIVPATEGFSDRLLNIKRYVLPVQSLIVATEPLSQSQWDDIGLASHPAFSDASRLATYGHRSADGRLVFGARGSYDFGGKVRSRFSLDAPEFRLRQRLVHELFPSLRGVRFTHGWGGTLGIARAFHPFAVFDRQSGIAHAGGYGGEGVGASNLFGRTLADLILQQETLLTSMPWVFRPATYRSALKAWEPEPLRWLAYQSLLRCFTLEEKLYSTNKITGRGEKLLGSFCDRLAGFME